jgi:hypothetical protein
MSVDFQQVRQQIKQFGEGAARRESQRVEKLKKAQELLTVHATDLAAMRRKIQMVVEQYDNSLRCALPVAEPLDYCGDPSPAPLQATLLAADGSQINPDRHAEIDYCLINAGAIRMRLASPALPPSLHVQTHLLYGDELFTQAGVITEAALALLRDVHERRLLAELAQDSPAPVFTLTDGPIELWGAKGDGANAEFSKQLVDYQDALRRLHEIGAISAGYVDKPGANLMVRALEVMAAPEPDLPAIKQAFPLRPITDRHLYQDILGPGQRSAVFAIQSQSARQYRGPLGLHFFYLNVGSANHPWLARVEIPAWVACDPAALDGLQAVLIQQCRLLGARPYPYILHRAHETALVSFDEKDQVTQMMIAELRQRGLPVGQKSYKQIHKNAAPRTSYK